MTKGISLDEAQRVVTGARQKADAEGLAMNVAVVDAGNNLSAFVRMDGAWLGSIDIALDKASTARSFDMPTKALVDMSQPGQALYGIDSLSGSKSNIVVFAGGIPLERDGEIVGAIGVSGGTPDQDHMVAEGGVAAFS